MTSPSSPDRVFTFTIVKCKWPAMMFLHCFVSDHVVIECLKGMEYDGRIMNHDLSSIEVD